MLLLSVVVAVSVVVDVSVDADSVDFDESRVLAADVAQARFPEVANHVAEAIIS